MKKVIYWLYALFGIIIILMITIPVWLSMFCIGSANVIIELLYRVDWWFYQYDKAIKVDYPFKSDLKEVFKSAFHL